MSVREVDPRLKCPQALSAKGDYCQQHYNHARLSFGIDLAMYDWLTLSVEAFILLQPHGCWHYKQPAYLAEPNTLVLALA